MEKFVRPVRGVQLRGRQKLPHALACSTAWQSELRQAIFDCASLFDDLYDVSPNFELQKVCAACLERA